MASDSNYALRLPTTLMADVKTASQADGVSMNAFIVQAVAEKVATLRARGLLSDLTPEAQERYLRTRAARSQRERGLQLLRQAGTTAEVLPGDELP